VYATASPTKALAAVATTQVRRFIAFIAGFSFDASRRAE
jgi:hypothetical protein